MRITEAAVEAILNIMNKKGLDPENYYFQVGVFEGNLGINFTNQALGELRRYGRLGVVVSGGVTAESMEIDYGLNNGRYGLIFKGE